MAVVIYLATVVVSATVMGVTGRHSLNNWFGRAFGAGGGTAALMSLTALNALGWITHARLVALIFQRSPGSVWLRLCDVALCVVQAATAGIFAMASLPDEIAFQLVGAAIGIASLCFLQPSREN